MGGYRLSPEIDEGVFLQGSFRGFLLSLRLIEKRRRFRVLAAIVAAGSSGGGRRWIWNCGSGEFVGC